MKNITWAAALAGVVLAGCAPATFEALRLKPAGEDRFVTQQNYQAVYRTILTNARRCYQTGMITAQMVVQGDLYSDTQTGEVTVALHGGLGVDTYLGIDVKALSPERTEVRTITGIGTWNRVLPLIRSWVDAGASSCT